MILEAQLRDLSLKRGSSLNDIRCQSNLMSSSWKTPEISFFFFCKNLAENGSFKKYVLWHNSWSIYQFNNVRHFLQKFHEKHWRNINKFYIFCDWNPGRISDEMPKMWLIRICINDRCHHVIDKKDRNCTRNQNMELESSIAWMCKCAVKFS